MEEREPLAAPLAPLPTVDARMRRRRPPPAPLPGALTRERMFELAGFNERAQTADLSRALDTVRAALDAQHAPEGSGPDWLNRLRAAQTILKVLGAEPSRTAQATAMRAASARAPVQILVKAMPGTVVATQHDGEA